MKKKKNTIIVGIIVALLFVLAVAGIIFASNQKGDMHDDKPMETPSVELDAK